MCCTLSANIRRFAWIIETILYKVVVDFQDVEDASFLSCVL